MCQVVHKIIGNGSERSGVSALKQRLNVMGRLGATRGCPPSPIRQPAQHAPGDVWQSRKRQGRGRRKMEETDKEARRVFLKVAALPNVTVRAQGVSQYWDGWSTRAGHTVGYSCPEGQS